MFRKVSFEEFDTLLAAAATSPVFDEALAEYQDYLGRLDRRYLDASVQEGPLRVDGPLRAPAFYALVLGDLTVDGLLDLRGAYDSGGVFIVVGSVRCTHFVSEIDAQVFIDGDLHVEGVAVTGFEDSSLNVVGSLRARLFIGNDIGASVGDGAVLEFGIGHWSALGSRNGPFFRPRHGEQATIDALLPPPKTEGYPYDTEDIAALIRAGQPIFK